MLYLKKDREKFDILFLSVLKEKEKDKNVEEVKVI